MASELGLSIKIGAVVGGALAALGSVQGQMRRLSETASALGGRQRALNQEMQNFVGPRTPAQIAAVNAQYERLGRTLRDLEARHARLATLSQRGNDLRSARQGMRSDAMDTLALGASVAAPVKLAIDFESAMADVKKVVDFERPEGFKRLGDDILALTRTLPLSATELASITASGGQLGVAERDLLGFTQTVAKMSTAFDMSAEDAGDSMAKLANVYQIPIAKIGNLGDAINELSNKSPAKASDIVRTLGRVGGVARQFGLTEMQAASLSNAFISLGKAPEVAGTAINGMLTKLGTADKQPAKFQAALKEMGLSASGLKKSIQTDAQGALVDFMGKLESVPAQQRMGLLVDLFGLEYADDVAVLAGSVKTYTDSIDVANSKGVKGSMEKEFAARAATTANNLKLLKNGMSELGIQLGSAVLPALNELVAGVKPLVISFASWAKENPGVVAGFMKVAAALAAAKIAALGVGYVINLGMSAVTTVMLAWTRAGAALSWLRAAWLLNGAGIVARLGSVATMAARSLLMLGRAVLIVGRAMLLNPIGLAVTAIAGAAYLIYRYWEPITAFFGSVWGRVRTTFNQAWTSLKSLSTSFMQLGRDLIDGLVKGISARLGAAKDSIVGVGRNIKEWFAATLGIKSPSRVFMGFGTNIGEGAALGIGSSVSRVKGAVGKLSGAALSGVSAASSALSTMAGGGGAAGGGKIEVHYAPTIQVQGGADVAGAVKRGLDLSLRELEQMIQRVAQEQARRAYG